MVPIKLKLPEQPKDRLGRDSLVVLGVMVFLWYVVGLTLALPALRPAMVVVERVPLGRIVLALVLWVILLRLIDRPILRCLNREQAAWAREVKVQCEEAAPQARDYEFRVEAVFIIPAGVLLELHGDRTRSLAELRAAGGECCLYLPELNEEYLFVSSENILQGRTQPTWTAKFTGAGYVRDGLLALEGSPVFLSGPWPE